MREDTRKMVEEFIRKQEQAALNSTDWEALMEQNDASQRSERVARYKWVHVELPRLVEKKPTSVGYPLGPWFTPYSEARDCYIYGFFRAGIAMCGSIAENICLNILLTIVHGDKNKYKKLTLGQLIGEIKKHIVFPDVKNVGRLTKINDIRIKWIHMQSDNWSLTPAQIKEERKLAGQDGKTALLLVQRILSGIFEVRPANDGRLQTVIHAAKKQQTPPS